MNTNRRLLLKGTATASVVGVAIAAGLLAPGKALAACLQELPALFRRVRALEKTVSRFEEGE